jgi:hypothetical protein
LTYARYGSTHHHHHITITNSHHNHRHRHRHLCQREDFQVFERNIKFMVLVLNAFSPHVRGSAATAIIYISLFLFEMNVLKVVYLSYISF